MHTQGKLHFDGMSYGHSGAEHRHTIRLSNNRHIVLLTLYPEGDDITEQSADARRLVAMWNACDGIPTEALEADCVRKLVEAATRFIEHYHTKHDSDNFAVLCDALAPFQEGSR